VTHIDATPWARARLSPADLAAIRARLPAGASLYVGLAGHDRHWLLILQDGDRVRRAVRGPSWEAALDALLAEVGA